MPASRAQLGALDAWNWHQLEIVKHLGRGSSATVVQCSFSSLAGKQMVAKKQIRTELLGDPQEVKIFLAEVKLLRTLNHK